jgi:hypothetical protein
MSNTSTSDRLREAKANQQAARDAAEDAWDDFQTAEDAVNEANKILIAAYEAAYPESTSNFPVAWDCNPNHRTAAVGHRGFYISQTTNREGDW